MIEISQKDLRNELEKDKRIQQIAKANVSNQKNYYYLIGQGFQSRYRKKELTEITNSVFDRNHEEIVAYCTVCNQFVKVSNSRLFPFNKVPKKCFNSQTTRRQRQLRQTFASSTSKTIRYIAIDSGILGIQTSISERTAGIKRSFTSHLKL